jgi:hypothetical protein
MSSNGKQFFYLASRVIPQRKPKITWIYSIGGKCESNLEVIPQNNWAKTKIWGNTSKYPQQKPKKENTLKYPNLTQNTSKTVD